MLLDNLASTNALIVVTLTGVVLLLSRYVSPSLDPLEPPLLKPRAPLVGHIISMFHEGSNFYARLFKERRMPICTLPILNGKLYVINSPDLIQSALRDNDISFGPFLVGFSKSLFGLSKNAVHLIEDESNMKGGLAIIHSALMGEPLHKLNLNSMNRLMTSLNRIKFQSAINEPNVFIWLRDILTDATATALFGEKNPVTIEKAKLLWIFDKHSILAAFGVPNFIISKATNARLQINKLLLSYYQTGGELGQGVSEIIYQRAIYLRSIGFTSDDLAHMELMLLWVGVTNTAPTLFWLFAHILTSRDYTSRVRAEIRAITTVTDGPEGRTATFDLKKLEKCCPFLNACYQETLRLYLHPTGNRRVMKETKIQDAEGRQYLLKKGSTVQWSPSVTHFTDEIWSEESETFKPERFLDVTAQDEKRRRGSMLSFGGGRNLCPGRRLAFTEILGFVGVIALSFEVEGLSLPRSREAGVGVGPRMPDWGSKNSGICLKRKPDWEDVTWQFKD